MKIFSLTLMLVLIFCSSAFAEENVSIISVSGDGMVEIPPDQAKISLGVVTRDKNPSNVQSANAKAANSVINAVISLGIARKNISTGNYSFNPVYRRSVDGRSEIDGYEATNSVIISVDNLNLVGKIIDTALNHGANRVDSLNFGLRDKNSAQDEALRLALLDAKRKAEIVASALGKSIVGVRNVSINSVSVNSPRNYKMARVAASEDSANVETPIESGTIRCSANVHVEFEISR